MKPDYVFISGVSRTGSTLLVQILNSSYQIAIARENWFLGHQVPWEGIRYSIKRNFGTLSKKTNAYELAEFIYNGQFKRNDDGYWLWLRKNIDPKNFLHRLLSAPDLNDRRIFLIMMEVYAEWLQRLKGSHFEKPILGEKTPSHIYYVDTLLKWFPNSRIIHTFRDPRAIFASELRRRRLRPLSFPYNKLIYSSSIFYLFILFQVTYTWLRATKLHLRYENIYRDRYSMLKFENLVIDPEKYIRRLCSFLQVEFNYEMLDREVVSYGFKHGQAGFDKNAPNRWKHLNPSWVNRWFSSWLGLYLEKLKDHD